MQACLTTALAAAGLSLVNVAVGLADLNSDEPDSVGDHLAVLSFSAALIGGAVALAVLRRVGADRLRTAWSLGLAVAVGGGAAAALGNLVEDSLGVSAFGLLFALGGLALVIGLLAAGGSVLAAAPPWRWVGVALILIAIGTAVGEQVGFTLVGLTWIALAFVLWRSTKPSTQRL